jgi:O-antigen/teichoic acid export membrane protein
LLYPEEYGYVALITVFTGFIIIFSDAGLSYVIIRSDYGRTFQRAVSNLSFYIGCMLFLFMLLFAYPISLFYDDPSLILPTITISLSFILSSLYIAPLAVIKKELNFNYVGKVNFFANITAVILMIFFAYLGFSFWSLIFPQLIMLLMQFILYGKKANLGLKFYRLSYIVVAFRKTRSLIFNISGFNLINYWARNSDNLIVGKFFGNHDLGIYNRSYKMLQLSLSLITGVFGSVLYPSLKKLESEGKDYRPEYQSILGVISLLNFPIGAILILFPEPFVKILWSERWIQVADFLPYFGLLILFQTLISTTGNIFVLVNREKTLFYLGGISAVATILSIVIGAFYSVLAIAISYTICNLVITIPLNVYYGFYRTFRFNKSFIYRFWMVKIILGVFILLANIYGEYYHLLILIFLYAIHLVHTESNQILQLVKLIGKKIRTLR